MHLLAINSLAVGETCLHEHMPASRQCKQHTHAPSAAAQSPQGIPAGTREWLRRVSQQAQYSAGSLLCSTYSATPTQQQFRVHNEPATGTYSVCAHLLSALQHCLKNNHGTLDHPMLYFPRRALQPPQQAYISVCCESQHVNIHNKSFPPSPHG
jgi:hypothetical protein